MSGRYDNQPPMSDDLPHGEDLGAKRLGEVLRDRIAEETCRYIDREFIETSNSYAGPDDNKYELLTPDERRMIAAYRARKSDPFCQVFAWDCVAADDGDNIVIVSSLLPLSVGLVHDPRDLSDGCTVQTIGADCFERTNIRETHHCRFPPHQRD